MKPVALVLGACLVLAGSAAAQVNAGNNLLLASPDPAFAAAPVAGNPGTLSFAAPAEPTPAAAEPIPTPASKVHEPVYGVLQDLNYQIFGGFTYFHFYELPGITGNLDGFSVSLVYYPHAGHLGVDGEFTAGFAPQNGVATTLDAGMGGGRFRLPLGRGLEIWAHALAGGAHFVPKTPYGGESAFAFEGGGGIDLTRGHSRLSYRVQADLFGSYFFSTYQYSPKITAGLVYKF